MHKLTSSKSLPSTLNSHHGPVSSPPSASCRPALNVFEIKILNFRFCYRKPKGVVSCHIHDITAVRNGAEIGLLSLRLSVSQGASVDFLLAPTMQVAPLKDLLY